MIKRHYVVCDGVNHRKKNWICQYCGLDLKTIEKGANRANHVRWCSLNPNRNHSKSGRKSIEASFIPWDLIQKDYDSGMTLGQLCNKYSIKWSTFSRNKKKYGFNQHRGIAFFPSAESREKMRKSRIRYLESHEHNWSFNHKISFPCNKFKDELRKNGISFIEEYRPLLDHFYQIDIAFPDKKIGIEVNGNQHYNEDKTLAPYYQKRKEEIEKVGWKLYDFHFSLFYRKNKIHEIIDFIKNQKLGSMDYLEDDWHLSKKKLWEIEKRERDRRAEEEKLKKIEQTKENLLKSGIDFSKFGWVNKASKIIGVSWSHVNDWMHSYMKEFYETQCFHKRAYG
jgi:very-short-patch-repair endonuclease